MTGKDSSGSSLVCNRLSNGGQVVYPSSAYPREMGDLQTCDWNLGWLRSDNGKGKSDLGLARQTTGGFVDHASDMRAHVCWPCYAKAKDRTLERLKEISGAPDM